MGSLNLGFPKRLGRRWEFSCFEFIETTLLAARSRVQYQDFHCDITRRFDGRIPGKFANLRLGSCPRTQVFAHISAITQFL